MMPRVTIITVVRNDKQHIRELLDMGWTPITIWECELKNDFEGTLEKVINEIKTSSQ